MKGVDYSALQIPNLNVVELRFVHSQCNLPMTFAISPSTSLSLVSEVSISFVLSFSPFFFLILIISLSEFEFSTFAEWLVDRKRVPADWRKRVAAIRLRISKEFSSLPKDSDPFFQTLDSEGSKFMCVNGICLLIVNYECLNIGG